MIAAGLATIAVIALMRIADAPRAPSAADTSEPRGAGDAAPLHASLVRKIASSEWFRPSPDPSGIAYQRASGEFTVVDSEVDEGRSLYRGSNVWMTDGHVHPTRSWSTMAFSSEPSDVAWGPRRTLIMSDDETHQVLFVRKGPDLRWGTTDDVISSLGVTAYGVGDPEGIAFGRGRLFVADGDGALAEIDPGANGFDGPSPAGDDVVRILDLEPYGVDDPEGVAYDARDGSVYVVTRVGQLVRVHRDWRAVDDIDVAEIPMIWPAGITFGPSLDGSATHLYISARGVDNGADPSENDGRIFEIALS